MFRQYATALRLPGAARFSAAGLLARMQLSMAGLGSVMLLSVVRDSYAVAGVVSAVFALSVAAISPQFSRLIDMRGQRRVVPFQLAVHLPAVVAMIVVAVYTQLTWPLYLLAVVAGGAVPSIGPLVRTRWSALLKGKPLLRTAYAWESLVDEIVFIVGPPLATVVALQLFPSAALILATSFLTIGTIWLLSQTRTEPVPAPNGHSKFGRPALFMPVVAVTTVVAVLLGGVFGSFEVTTVAFAREHGQGPMAGLILALYAAGSLLGGLIYGGLRWRRSLRGQFVTVAVLLALTTLPLPFLGTTWQLAGGLFIAGVACAPTLISSVSLVEHGVPSHRLTEAIAWSGSGMAVGVASATPLAGYFIDTYGASTAYWVTTGCAIGAAVLAVVCFPVLRNRPVTELGGSGSAVAEPGVNENVDAIALVDAEPLEILVPAVTATVEGAPVSAAGSSN